jgi:hypothetical protein
MSPDFTCPQTSHDERVLLEPDVMTELSVFPNLPIEDLAGTNPRVFA